MAIPRAQAMLLNAIGVPPETLAMISDPAFMTQAVQIFADIKARTEAAETRLARIEAKQNALYQIMARAFPPDVMALPKGNENE